METVGSVFDAEWESICKLLSIEESDSTAHLLDYSPLIQHDDTQISTAPLTLSDENVMGNYLEEKYLNYNGCADNTFLTVPCENDLFLLNDPSLGLLFVEDAVINEGASADNQSSCSTELTLKRKLNSPVLVNQIEEKSSSSPTLKKRARIHRTTQKGKRKAQTKKGELNALVNDEADADIAHENSEDESNVSEEVNEVGESESSQATELTSNGKKRASRGAATDPQSLYARKRRMRINERLRILQKLVPNGTKVDISTMLEEAFHYVKFLQLQIRLLSSDDLWMYAPLAYNGFDVGDYERMSPFLGL